MEGRKEPDMMLKENVKAFVMIEGYIWKEVKISKIQMYETVDESTISLEGVLKDPYEDND